MIIVMAPGDATIVSQSRAQSYNFPAIYGETYIAGGRAAIPQAAPGENVFFVGHGVSQGGSGNAEIGEAAGDFGMDGEELWDNFKEIFPDLYNGDVYIDACASADPVEDLFSVIETFKAQSAITLDSSAVFGRTGSPVGDIPQPGDAAWVEAI